MKRASLVIGVLGALAHGLAAQEANPSASPSPSASPPLPPPAVSLQEAAGLSITQRWADRSYAAMDPQPGPDGAIVFRFGESTPTVVGEVLQVTDVELQPGEVVNEVEAGDSERWAIEPAVSGVVASRVAGAGDPAGVPTEHVVIKPKEPNLQTSLILTTDRRTYHLRLVSRDVGYGYMEHIRFVYADAPVKTVAAAPLSPPPEMPPATAKAPVALTEPVRRRQGAKGTAKAAVFLGQAEGPGRTDVRDHDFRISGHAPFRPTQVYTDGRKTYIELPEGVQESPVLFRRKKGGFLGLGHSLQLVNHRYHGRWVVVDAVLDDAVLQSGVGSAKTQVVISRVAAHE